MSDDEALRRILESGKEWQDRMSARGFTADPRFPRDDYDYNGYDYGYGHNSGERDYPSDASTEPSSGGSLIWMLVVGLGWAAIAFLIWIIPIIVGIFWEILKAIFSGGGRGRRR